MKKLYGLAMVLIILMALAIVAWGAWLNYSDENQIANRMDNRAVELTGVRAKTRDFTPAMSLDAVRFRSYSMTDAVAMTDGRVLKWHVSKNGAVHKGDVLLTMVNENIPLKIQQAESAISRAEAALTQTRNNYQRQSRLLERRATSQAKYEEAEAQYLAAQGSLREAQAQKAQCLIQQDWLTVKAPVDGEVLIIYQREGAQVQAGTPLALVGDFDSLYFSLNMTEEAAHHLEIGEKGILTLPDSKLLGKVYDTDFGAGNKGDETEITVTLTEITPSLSGQSDTDMHRTVWQVDNRAHMLEPMTYTGVMLRMGVPHRALTVPLKAMVDKDHDRVFVVDENGRLHLRQVTTGAEDGKYIEIYDGLAEGDIVIVGNLDGLEEGMKAEVELEGEDK